MYDINYITVHSKLDLLHEQLEKGGVKVDTSEATEAATYAKLPLKKRMYSIFIDLYVFKQFIIRSIHK